MYCSACGTQTAPDLSYCNRCGAILKTRSNAAFSAIIAAYLTAITVVALGGLGILLGGALVLRNEAHFGGEIIGLFMAMSFLVTMTVEIYLCRHLSRLTVGSEKGVSKMGQLLSSGQRESGPTQPRVLPEPLPSVTENTTRTLEYSYSDQQRR